MEDLTAKYINYKNKGYFEVTKENFKVVVTRENFEKILKFGEFQNLINTITSKLSDKAINIFNYLTLDTDIVSLNNYGTSSFSSHIVSSYKLREINNKNINYNDLIVLSKITKNINYNKLLNQDLSVENFEKIEIIKNSFKPGMNFVYKQIVMKREVNNTFNNFLILDRKRIRIIPENELKIFKYFMQFKHFDFENLNRLILVKSMNQM